MNPLSEGIGTLYMWIVKTWDTAIYPIFSSLLEHLQQGFSNFKLYYLILEYVRETIFALLYGADIFLWTLTKLDTFGDVLVALLKIISILLFFFFLILLAKGIFKKKKWIGHNAF